MRSLNTLFLLSLLVTSFIFAELSMDELDSIKARYRQPWQKASWVREHRRKKFSEVYSGKEYSIEELKKSIRLAVENKAAEVVIKPGIYRTTSLGAGGIFLELKNITNLQIKAKDVLILGESVNRMIALVDCSGVTISGLTMDYSMKGLPYTQGTVVELDSGYAYAVIEIHKGYPSPYNPGNRSRKVAAYDSETLLLKEDVWTMYNRKYETYGRKVKIFKIDDGVREGDILTLLNEENIAHGVTVGHSENISFMDVTLHAAPMFAFLSYDSKNVRYTRVRITPGPMPDEGDFPRVKSGNQDGIHISDMQGKGDIIEDCIIEAHSDDAVAVNSGYSIVLEKKGKVHYVTSKHGRINITPEATLGHTRVRDMQELGESKVISIEPVDDETSINRLEGLLVSFKQDYNIRDAGLQKKTFWKVVLDRKYNVEGGEFLSLRSGNRGLVLKNTYIANHRARSLLLKTSGATIENNVIFHSMNSSIVMSPERFWTEGGYSRDMVIRGNLFLDCGYGPNNPGSSQAAMINIIGMGDKGEFAAAGNHRNIIIENNRFVLCHVMPLIITAAEDVRVRGNLFQYTHFRRSSNGQKNGYDQSKIIWAKNSKNIIYENNTITKSGEYLSPDPVYQDNVEGLEIR